MSEAILQNMHKEMESIVKRLRSIEENVAEIHDDLHIVRPEYLEKLEKIKNGKQHHFVDKKEFLQFLHNEI